MSDVIYAESGRKEFRLEDACRAVSAGLIALALWNMPSEATGAPEMATGAYQDSQVKQPCELLPLGESKAGLTLTQLEQTALATNPSVARAAAIVGAARGNWVQVGLPPNPAVGYDGQQLGSGGLAEQHGVVFSQEIVRGGKLTLNRAIANGEIMVAEQELATQELRVLTDVRIAFYDVLLAERQIELADNLVRISGEGTNAVDALFQAKEAGRADLLQAQPEMENAQILAQNAHNRHDAAWRSLAAVVGNPELPPSPLAGDAMALPVEISFAETLARILASSPEIAASAMRVERATAALQRARAQPTPNVNFEGLLNWQDNGIGGKADGGVRVTMPVPIFDRNQGAIRQAEHELAAARRALSQLELDLQSRLAPTFEQFSNTRNQVRRYRELLLPAAEESLQLTRQLYSSGESNYIGLLTAQRTFAQTHWNYFDAVRTLRTTEAQIEGFLLQGSLQTQDSVAR